MRLLYEDTKPRCSKGIRLYCTMHNIDFLKFVREGIDTEELENLDDPLIAEAIHRAELRDGR